jgi:hypothetical protein
MQYVLVHGVKPHPVAFGQTQTITGSEHHPGIIRFGNILAGILVLPRQIHQRSSQSRPRFWIFQHIRFLVWLFAHNIHPGWAVSACHPGTNNSGFHAPARKSRRAAPPASVSKSASSIAHVKNGHRWPCWPKRERVHQVPGKRNGARKNVYQPVAVLSIRFLIPEKLISAAIA